MKREAYSMITNTNYATLLEKEKWENALPLVLQLVEQQPANAEYRRDLGKCLAGLGRDVEAADQFRLAYQLNPQDGGSLYNIFWCLFRTSDPEAFLVLAKQECPKYPTLLPLLAEDFETFFERPEFAELAASGRATAARREARQSCIDRT